MHHLVDYFYPDIRHGWATVYFDNDDRGLEISLSEKRKGYYIVGERDAFFDYLDFFRKAAKSCKEMKYSPNNAMLEISKYLIKGYIRAANKNSLAELYNFLESEMPEEFKKIKKGFAFGKKIIKWLPADPNEGDPNDYTD